METCEIAHTILFGERLEDKLCPVEGFTDERPGGSIVAPSFPGREKNITSVGRSPFPKDLRSESSRGAVLHFFANHELLATELMALLLLRFPEAEPEFRKSIVQTIGEEQEHLKLYLSRMRELGVDFGELPVNAYFWNTLKEMSSPLDFVVQMSLTFEQANLDYSLHYMEKVERTGDSETARILKRVYDEEIGHVKNGLVWFNRWRDPKMSEWESYCSHLPKGMTPSRAKGIGFSHQARELAGFTQDYIRQIAVYGGSKGRPPIVRIFNGAVEAELARGSKGHFSKANAQETLDDLAVLPTFIARTGDIIVAETPSTEWQEGMKRFEAPKVEYAHPISQIQAKKLEDVQPWGWSADTKEHLKHLSPRVLEEKPWMNSNHLETLQRLSTKSFASRFFESYLESHPHPLINGGNSLIAKTFEEAKGWIEPQIEKQQLLLKAPLGTAGRQVRSLRGLQDWTENEQGWIKNILKEQGEIIVEDLHERVADLSLQLLIDQDKVQQLGIRHVEVDAHYRYRKSFAGRALSTLPEEAFQLLHQNGLLEYWKEMAEALGEASRSQGYVGPAGIDAYVFRSHNGLNFRPLVEVNLRWTMGHIFLGVEKLLFSNTPAQWRLISKKEAGTDLLSHSNELRTKFPLQSKIQNGREKISEGVFFTNDPARAKQVLSVLLVGKALSAS